MYNIIIFLSIITVLLYFFWSTGILLGSTLLPYSLVLTYILLFLFSTKFKIFIKTIYKEVQETPLKYFLFFILWGILTSFFVIIKHNSFLIIYRIIRDYFLFVFPILIIPTFLIIRYFTLKKLTKLIVLLYSFIILFGLFDYFIQLTCPHLHLFIFHIICNNTPNYISTLKRANSIFFEPTFFATFIFVFLPFLYNLQKIKFNVLRIPHFLELLIILSWTALFCTKSPIYILASIIYFIIYYRKKKSLYIYTFIILIFILLNSGNIAKNPVINRIVKATKSFGSMETLIYAEGSLATRLGLMHLSLQIASEHPFIGTGYANSKELMYAKIINSKIPLTDEIIRNNFLHEGLTISSVFFQTLCWNGIIGVGLLYTFLIKTILIIKKLKKHFNKQYYYILSSYEQIAINYLLCSIYWSLIADTVMWFIFGIMLAFIFKYKKLILLKLGGNNETNRYFCSL